MGVWGITLFEVVDGDVTTLVVAWGPFDNDKLAGKMSSIEQNHQSLSQNSSSSVDRKEVSLSQESQGSLTNHQTNSLQHKGHERNVRLNTRIEVEDLY